MVQHGVSVVLYGVNEELNPVSGSLQCLNAFLCVVTVLMQRCTTALTA